MSKMLPVNKVVESVSITHKFDKPILKFLNTSDVENGKIVNINHLPIEELKGQAKKTIKKHDILFSEIRPKNRRFAYVDIEDTYDFVVSTKLMVLRNVNPEVDNKYFYYFLTNDHMLSILQDRAENRIGSFPQITFDLLSEYFIRVPQISEQQKIASVLSTLDAKIELNNRIHAELEGMAKLVYDYWFVQFDFPDSDGKPYKSSGGKMVWNAELKREVPEGWEVKTLGDLVDLVNNVVSPSDLDDTTPYIGLEHIPRKTITLSEWETAEKVDSQKSLFQENDILFGKIRPYFHKVGVAFINGITSTDTFVFRPKQKHLHGIVLQSVFSDHFVGVATDSSTGSKMPRASWPILEKYPIIVPNDNLVCQYESLSSTIISQLKNNVMQNNELRKLRNWLLPMLMNGQVRVGEK